MERILDNLCGANELESPGKTATPWNTRLPNATPTNHDARPIPKYSSWHIALRAPITVQGEKVGTLDITGIFAGILSFLSRTVRIAWVSAYFRICFVSFFAHCAAPRIFVVY